jgi:hypothetical protein
MAVARHRERGSFSAVATEALFTELGTPAGSPTIGTVLSAEGSLSVMDDDATPGFARGKAMGFVRCNPMLSTSETRVFGKGVVTFVKPRTVAGQPRDWTYKATNLLFGAPVLTLSSLPSNAFPSYADLITEVATKARGRIKAPDF